MLHSPVAHAGVDVRCLSALFSQRLLNVVETVPSTIMAQGGETPPGSLPVDAEITASLMPRQLRDSEYTIPQTCAICQAIERHMWN